MTGDQLKAAFEAWAGKRGYALDSMTYDDGAVEYHSAETWSLWLGWQAATASHAAEVAELRRLIADDAYACTFQTFGQYRTALLKAADAALKGD
jgi:hypothetical protein